MTVFKVASLIAASGDCAMLFISQLGCDDYLLFLSPLFPLFICYEAGCLTCLLGLLPFYWVQF